MLTVTQNGGSKNTQGSTTMYQITATHHDGELTDQELLNLVNYFEVSRVELKNRVDSLLSQPILQAKQNDSQGPKLFEDDYIKIHGNSLSLKLYSQGDQITLATASTLRLLANNSTIHSFSQSWLSAKFSFRDYTNPLNYGLLADRTGARGLILCVQGFVLRHLLLKNVLSESQHRSISVSVEARTEALVDALTEMLWQAGEYRGATVCIPYSGDACFTNHGDHYVPDRITERLHMFEFIDLGKLRSFIIKCLPYFMKENGVIIFLYSLMLSRTLKKLIEDLDHTRLVGERDESTIQMVTLALTGRALHYFHNGVIDVDSDGNLMKKPQHGVKNRSSVGFLYWSKHEDDSFWHKQEIGSMFRTPKVPVWLICLNRRYAIVFSSNINLLNNWIYENYFQLHLYSGLKKQEQPCIVSIDTRQQYPASIYGDFFEDNDQHAPDIIHLLQSRWPGCTIDNADEILHELMTIF
ncbi:unnamed protein product [Rotaria magnacalcarata]|uniref:Ubiquitin carboxyl-terminal hydrolase MINDY n=3 Tax=Rotaria magnacalcarata TaxID=392030 RepID=A0A816XJP4_9BILA|nr:unnamed protein product [Rotaria magnacalcarata]CAF2106357.1 unnamed protein product [Rotaria magnacalcarata]CAF2118174.1 unnamed protein product [Rotaria magnacalcarata]CAF2147474.1 unnamed protein product [Rotaria magnacalcarata]